MLRTDVMRRALPWSRLVLDTQHAPEDLNLRASQRLCGALSGVALAAFTAAPWWPSLLRVSGITLAASRRAQSAVLRAPVAPGRMAAHRARLHAPRPLLRLQLGELRLRRARAPHLARAGATMRHGRARRDGRVRNRGGHAGGGDTLGLEMVVRRGAGGLRGHAGAAGLSLLRPDQSRRRGLLADRRLLPGGRRGQGRVGLLVPSLLLAARPLARGGGTGSVGDEAARDQPCRGLGHRNGAPGPPVRRERRDAPASRRHRRGERVDLEHREDHPGSAPRRHAHVLLLHDVGSGHHDRAGSGIRVRNPRGARLSRESLRLPFLHRPLPGHHHPLHVGSVGPGRVEAIPARDPRGTLGIRDGSRAMDRRAVDNVRPADHHNGGEQPQYPHLGETRSHEHGPCALCPRAEARGHRARPPDGVGGA